ncbi:MAG TPA: endonuclease III, partial [Nannocystaceae bacterium]|nr:endonuclease III [Nannocystaceae bacterium]
MKRSDRIARVSAVLDELVPMAEIPLDHEDPFTLLVAVMLSAQTTDKKVNEVTPALFALASTPAA